MFNRLIQVGWQFLFESINFVTPHLASKKTDKPKQIQTFRKPNPLREAKSIGFGRSSNFPDWLQGEKEKEQIGVTFERCEKL